jgi:hypothetical protein
VGIVFTPKSVIISIIILNYQFEKDHYQILIVGKYIVNYVFLCYYLTQKSYSNLFCEDNTMKKQHVTLSDSDRKRLNNQINKGTHPARVIKRAHALSALDNGTTLSAAATQVHSTTVSVRKWRWRFSLGLI